MTAAAGASPSNVDIHNLANLHVAIDEGAVFRFSKRGLLAFARALLDQAGADGVDVGRLNELERAGGFFKGQASGKPAFRIVGTGKWHPSLREAVDRLQRDVDAERDEPT